MVYIPIKKSLNFSALVRTKVLNFSAVSFTALYSDFSPALKQHEKALKH